MSMFLSVYLPMFAGGAVLGASVMWCLCRYMMRKRFERRTAFYRGR